jgi:hypothetical protein
MLALFHPRFLACNEALHRTHTQTTTTHTHARANTHTHIHTVAHTHTHTHTHTLAPVTGCEPREPPPGLCHPLLVQRLPIDGDCSTSSSVSVTVATHDDKVRKEC